MEETYNTYERTLIRRALQKGIPLSASFELSPLCNMNCRMCYVRLSKEEMKEKGRLRTAREWIELAHQMRDAGTLFIILTGGEPLLYLEFKAVYLGLRKLGMIITVNTNGTILDEAWANFFAANPPRRINITLYGTDKETYRDLCRFENGYEKALKGIELLVKRKVAVKINGSLVQANEKQIDEIVKIANELGTAVNVDTYMYPAQRERTKPFDLQARLSPEKAATAKLHFMKQTMEKGAFKEMCRQTMESVQLIEQETLKDKLPEKMHCQAGRTSFAVSWQGKMQPCVMLNYPSFPIFEIGVKSSWQQLKNAVNEIYLSGECSVCKYRTVCQTCAACALHEGGSFDAVPKYMCRYTYMLADIQTVLLKHIEENG